MSVYYNEHDPFAAQWLRNLITAGHLPSGDVDERDIQEVRPNDVQGYTQAHFFAGIGGWPLALRLAGWPDDRPVWTGSCPCQPFSPAGKQLGTKDARHLWPEFYRLIADCRPSVVFGEQTTSPAGRQWLAGVCADLERVGYAIGAADLPAASVGAPHIRQRLWWVADAELARRATDSPRERREGERLLLQSGTARQADANFDGAGADGGMGHTHSAGARRDVGAVLRAETPCEGQGGEAWNQLDRIVASDPWRDAALIPCTDGKTRRLEPGCQPVVDGLPSRVGRLRAYGNAIVPQVAAQFIGAYQDVSAWDLA